MRKSKNIKISQEIEELKNMKKVKLYQKDQSIF